MKPDRKRPGGPPPNENGQAYGLPVDEDCGSPVSGGATSETVRSLGRDEPAGGLEHAAGAGEGAVA